MRTYLLPQSFDLLAAANQVEGIPIPAAISNAAFAFTNVNRYSGEITRDRPGELGRSSGTPVPSSSATATWSAPAGGVSSQCRCAPRLSTTSASVTGPIRFLASSRRGDANSVSVGSALTLGLQLLGPADPTCPSKLSTFDDVPVARAALRIVYGYSGPC